MSTASLIPPMPALEPLQLLYVTNGSPLTAERWWLAHDYYQHRQNLHYQSLHQPGIVRGLGVRVIAPPDTVSSDLRDHRWVEIQPGMAIDLTGNPIVVEAPILFRITTEVIDTPATVYVVLAYVNPRKKQWASIPADVVKEEFRINERTTPPEPQEVELCRLVLNDNQTALQNAVQVLAPTPHELDLCNRQRVQMRAPYSIQVGLVSQGEESPYRDRLLALLTATASLYPSLASPAVVHQVTLTPNQQPLLSNLTVLFISYEGVIALNQEEIQRLQQYVATGGTVLIEYADNRSPLRELQQVQTELLSALEDLETVETGSDLAQMRQELMAELSGCQAVAQTHLQAIAQPIQRLACLPVDGTTDDDATTPPATPPAALMPIHQPFCFDALPVLPTGAVQLQGWDGVSLIIGSLSAAWTSQQFDQPIPRHTLRSAQELGINILYQAHQRQRIKHAQQASEVTPA